ncbi:hypothetical protein GCM10010124_23520 [Pilimelia terevasa]|uniref:Uncharacterized protein n=1 Tax=Pilimelia terevasa TaxID=53372 RepID=A0A8J3FKT2_9ACTN|nr:hypothetical protein [Pilimelia terevasa]GGK30058.1 hypothetical protein GCM10010124_23520 [Pilimelia terevasa]
MTDHGPGAAGRARAIARARGAAPDDDPGGPVGKGPGSAGRAAAAAAARESAAAESGGRRRRSPLRSWSPGVAVLALAVAAAGLLLLGPRWRERDTGRPVPLGEAYPAARTGALPAHLPDGPAYDPALLLDADTSVGTAPTPDGRTLRLVLHRGGQARTLRALPVGADPLFGGLTVAGDTLIWAETVSGTGGAASSSLWTAAARGAGEPVRLTADTGALAFFHSAYDLVVAEDRLRWVAVGAGATPVTQLRSVPLTGGAVTVRDLPGQWTQSAWPWLVSAAEDHGQPARFNLATNQRAEVPAGTSDLVACGPQWCRVQVLGDAGPSRLDAMRPDGGGRREIAGPGTSAAVTDVAVLDRFEVLTRASEQGAADSQQELLLYDLARRRMLVVAQGVGLVNSRDGWLWWSTGGTGNTRWHTLDLRALA